MRASIQHVFASAFAKVPDALCVAHRKWTDATRSPHLFIHARPGADPDGVGREYD